MFIRRQATSIKITPEDIIELDEYERLNKQKNTEQAYSASSYSTNQQFYSNTNINNNRHTVSSEEIGDESSLMYDTIDEKHLRHHHQKKSSDDNNGNVTYEGSSVTNQNNNNNETANHNPNSTTANSNTSFNSSIDVMDISHNSSADGNWTMKESDRNYRIGVLPR